MANNMIHRTASKTADTSLTHKLAPKVCIKWKWTWIPAAITVRNAQSTKKVSVLDLVATDGIETIYWTIPGAMAPMVERKKILQSRRTRLSCEWNFANDGFERQVVDVGIGLSKSLLVHCLESHKSCWDKWILCLGCLGLSITEQHLHRVWYPLMDHETRSWVAFSTIIMNFSTTAMSWCCRAATWNWPRHKRSQHSPSSHLNWAVSQWCSIQHIRLTTIWNWVCLFPAIRWSSHTQTSTTMHGAKIERKGPMWRAPWWFGRQAKLGYNFFENVKVSSNADHVLWCMVRTCAMEVAHRIAVASNRVLQQASSAAVLACPPHTPAVRKIPYLGHRFWGTSNQCTTATWSAFSFPVLCFAKITPVVVYAWRTCCCD